MSANTPAQRPVLDRIPAEIAAPDDYQRFAAERMSAQAWAYFAGGAADGLTLRDNVEAFRRLKLQNRVLGDLAGGNTRINLLGTDLDYPILLAPIAHQRLAHPDGELASVVAASAMSACMIVSTQASTLLEDIAKAGRAPLWFQLYWQPDRNFTLGLVKRAEAAGYRALVVTVDAPVNGVRNREQRAGFALPPGEAVNLKGSTPLAPHIAQAGASPLFGSGLLAAAGTWKDIEWLRSQTPLPLLLKGVIAPADARRALDAGIDGLVVSNHGGRTLDTLPATIDALPAVADAVKGRMPLLVDGGIRRGTDVLKALALGASAVLIGRPYIYALAAAGATGVAHVLHMLRGELEVAMALTGCKTLQAIDRSILWSTDGGGGKPD